MRPLAVAFAVLLAVHGHAWSAGQKIEDLHGVEIGKVGDRVLHAEISLPAERSKKLLPAIVWIHGGGWSGGNYLENPARLLAARGFFTMSIEYRLSGEAKWPAQIEDCKMAIRWLRANAAKYHVDPDRIGVWGQSAGGHLACLVAMMDESAGYDKSGGNPGVSSRVQAVLDYSGPTDLVTGRATYGKPLETLFPGGSYRSEKVLRQASPLTYVRPGLPPFLIVHGDCDTSVPYAESVRLKERLDRAKVPAGLLTIHGGDHIYEGMPDGPKPTPDSKAFRKAVFSFFDRTLK